MINKYTLQFIDKAIEQKYQEYQLQMKRKPILQKVIMMTFLIIIAKLIALMINFSLKDVYSTIGYLVVNMVFILILKFQPHLIRWILIIINYGVLIFYYEPDEGKTQYKHQLSSALIVSYQFIVMNTGEFIDTLVQVISFYAFYLAYFIEYQPDYSVSLTLATFLLSFLLIITFYENASAERSKFKLTIIENKWDEILQNMIVEPCVIFNYNYLKSSFILKKSIEFIYTIESTEELKQFLRNSIVNQSQKTNLENFIYKKVQQLNKDNIQIWNQKLTIVYLKKVHNIYYSILSDISPIILIKVKPFKFSKNESELEDKYQYKYKILIKSILNQFKLISQKQFPNLNTIFKICIYHYLHEKIEKQIISFIKISKILNQLQLIYPYKQITIENYQKRSTIYGHKNLLYLVLIEVFEIMLSKQMHIRIINSESSTKLFIYGILIERAKEKLTSRLLYYQSNLEALEITNQYVSLVLKQKLQSLN
ncbi:unnamed protein product [Paramecium primaurelia]|uniref:Transmembrane protein n=1 Tax=Paramecium primaurelia TaxID=5886 RepID=A0A8S1N7I5_PARPR|nr:unnamed protein product [Paramecium primaurelia]